MTRDEVLAFLAQHQAELAAFGLRRLALFGSVARNEAGPNSDVDVLVEFDGDITFKRYAKLYDVLEKILPCRVDLVTEGGLRPILRESAKEDAYKVVPHSSEGVNSSRSIDAVLRTKEAECVPIPRPKDVCL